MKIDGREIANEILQDLKKRVEKLKEKGITPHLAIVLVGKNPQSAVYVEQKELKGTKIGIKTSIYKFPNSISTKDLINNLNDLNHLIGIHGIIVQRPLPSQIVNSEINRAINPKKDVDAFNPDSPYNPPVAEAILRLLEHILGSNNKVDQNLTGWLNSQSVVILGKGETGGGPVIKTFKKMGINFEIVDSRTKDAQQITKQADIVISAIGKPNILKPQALKEGVILISIGLSKGSDGKLHGDYEEEKIKNIASFYTPTPGGVGPVNVAFLLRNLVEATEDLSRNLL